MTTAAAFVRRAIAVGAMVARPDSTFVTAALRELGGRRNLGLMKACAHADPSPGELAMRATVEVILIPTLGPAAFTLLCPECFDLDRPDGCQNCVRPLAPSLRLVVSPAVPGHGEVFITALCRHCRRGQL